MELDRCIESWRVQYIEVGRPKGWRLLERNPRAAAPDALTPKTAPMDRAKYSHSRWPDNPYD
jgi:hypothetical protein